jgi:hypothetical protein
MPAQATWPHDGARRRSLLQMGREREEGEASARGGGSRGACGMARPRKERNRADQTTQGVLEEARQNGNIRCPSEMSQFMTSNNKPDSSRKRSKAREDEREVGGEGGWQSWGSAGMSFQRHALDRAGWGGFKQSKLKFARKGDFRKSRNQL